MLVDEPNSHDKAPDRVPLVVPLSSLFAGPPEAVAGWDERVMRIAGRVQAEAASRAHLAEISQHEAGQKPGRMAENLGRAASAGEQLALAVTCLRDARRWMAPDADQARVASAVKALTEMAGYFAISAANGIANVIFLSLVMHPATEAGIRGEHEYIPAGYVFEPFVFDRSTSVGSDKSEAKRLRRAARPLGSAVLDDWVALLGTLATDARWIAVTDSRDKDYHRWRPQTHAGGVPQSQPWVDLGNGQRSLTIGLEYGHTPPEPARLIAQVEAAVDLLADITDAWWTGLFDAWRELGVEPFQFRED